LHHKNPFTLLWNTVWISCLVQRYGIQIVHARSRAPAWSAWFATRLPIFTRAHFITTFHGTYGTSGILKRWYNGAMLRGPWVIANSQFIAKHIHATYGYPASRIVVAERGVDEAVFNPHNHSAAARKKLR